jgi:hypothetical protein
MICIFTDRIKNYFGELLMRQIKHTTSFIFVILSFTFGDKGVVVKEDVCGLGNAIIETSDGWYIAAEHYSGVYLYEGNVVYGKMKTY